MRVLANNDYVEVVCPHCKSKLGAHKGDVRENGNTHAQTDFELTCGVCGKTVEIPNSVIPNSWAISIIPTGC